MAQTKLSKQQRAILAALAEQSPLAIKALNSLAVARSSVSRALSRLQERNMVERLQIIVGRRKIPAVRLTTNVPLL